jgi:hypothetical protein
MTRLFKYLSAYVMWLVDLGLAFWLVLLTRTTYLTIFAAFYTPGGWAYTQRVGFADKAFILILGLGWLIFMIVAEAYFRRNAVLDGLFGRFTRITGPLLLCVFGVDLLLFWLQGGGDWRRWLILAAELSLGLVLVLYTRSHQNPSPSRRFST